MKSLTTYESVTSQKRSAQEELWLSMPSLVSKQVPQIKPKAVIFGQRLLEILMGM